MVTGLVVLTWSFHNLELTDRPEWMNWQTLLWPLLVLGITDSARWWRARRAGLVVRPDWTRLVIHGFPSALITLLPAGAFTNLFGPQVALSLLDFPTAKVMAAFWFAATVTAAWEAV
ncbi:MAG: hypothetical protein K6V97_05045 [Actinomycetia bacterium]|nr:hypothetical protein [Actinomycetes bacterium]